MKTLNAVRNWEFFYVPHSKEVVIIGTKMCKVPSRTNIFKNLTLKANMDNNIKRWGYRIIKDGKD